MEELSLDALTTRVGLSVRTIRFYTARGLIPAPIRRGRSGFYTTDHVARLELIQELQSHGFTLSAIEKYLEAIPQTATPGDIALHRTMLTPWQAEPPTEMTRTELDRRTARQLSDADLQTLTALGILRPGTRGRFRVAVSQLSVGIGLLDLGLPTEAAVASAEIYAAHGHAMAQELDEVFRKIVWPAYTDPDRLREVVERLKPLSVASVVTAYEAAMGDVQRAAVTRRASRN